MRLPTLAGRQENAAEDRAAERRPAGRCARRGCGVFAGAVLPVLAHISLYVLLLYLGLARPHKDAPVGGVWAVGVMGRGDGSGCKAVGSGGL